MNNANFRIFPTPGSVDAHGFDVLDYRGRTVQNVRTYGMARLVADSYVEDNNDRIQAQHEAYRAHFAALEENARRQREYEDRMRFYSKIRAYNALHPYNPIPCPAKPKAPRMLDVPELVKVGRINGVKTLRWYEKDKAPMQADTVAG